MDVTRLCLKIFYVFDVLLSLFVPSLRHWDPIIFFNSIFIEETNMPKVRLAEACVIKIVVATFRDEFSPPRGWIQLKVVLALQWGMGVGKTQTRKEEWRWSCLPCRVKMGFGIEPECCMGTLRIPLIQTVTGKQLVSLWMSWGFCLATLLSNHFHNLLLMVKGLDTLSTKKDTHRFSSLNKVTQDDVETKLTLYPK